MSYAKYGNYDKLPLIDMKRECLRGYKEIAEEIRRRAEGKKKFVVLLDCYVGADTSEIEKGFGKFLKFSKVYRSEDCAKESKVLDAELYDYLTDDRVFGFMCHKTLDFLFDAEKVSKAKEKIAAEKDGMILVIGVGAGYLCESYDVRIFADMARWEIQLRYRKGMPNFNTHNEEAPVLSKYKRGFFVEWRMCDKYKMKYWDTFDYVLDTNKQNDPKMISGKDFFDCLKTLTVRPFRLTPYFDPGVWGGQWMKDVCGLDKNEKNFAWSFDGVPEENSVNFKFGDAVVELPAINTVLYAPRGLLGDKVHARFGTEFPIRFDFLDTIEGQNLSLQVHPLTEYIQKTFGMNYTQDESYYILDTKGEDTCVYLGVKKDVDKAAMERDLYAAQRGEIIFPDEKYVNRLPVKKHDHVLIPAGTVHCSGTNTMVLEISATPYIFTFKLWDWARLGLDGLPRPTHIAHGMQNIQFDRDTDWVKENLVHREVTLCENENGKIERTGLHKREFIETRRYTTKSEICVDRTDSVCMCNLVDGKEARVESISGKFEPFTVHYAETFIVPYDAGEWKLVSPDGSEVRAIVATVR